MKTKPPGRKSAITVGICFIAIIWLAGTKRVLADPIKVLPPESGEKISVPDCARHNATSDGLMAGCLTPSIVFSVNHTTSAS